MLNYVKYDNRLKNISRKLRRVSTPEEIEMWKFLKSCYPGLKFNRQKPLDYFIADFYCKAKSLVIEIDGKVHDNTKERDAERDNMLEMKHGLTIVRIANDVVMKDKVKLKRILDEALG